MDAVISVLVGAVVSMPSRFRFLGVDLVIVGEVVTVSAHGCVFACALGSVFGNPSHDDAVSALAVVGEKNQQIG